MMLLLNKSAVRDANRTFILQQKVSYNYLSKCYGKIGRNALQ